MQSSNFNYIVKHVSFYIYKKKYWKAIYLFKMDEIRSYYLQKHIKCIRTNDTYLIGLQRDRTWKAFHSSRYWLTCVSTKSNIKASGRCSRYCS